MKSKDFNNPYLQNRREWSDIVTQAKRQVSGWRTMSLCCVVLSLVSICGVIWLGSRSKIVPLVVVLDDNGLPVKTHLVTDHADSVDERYIKGDLSEIIMWIRSVTYDRSLHTNKLNEIKLFFPSSSPAFTKVQEYILSEDTNPFKRAEKEIVGVRIENIVQLQDNVWQVDWEEKTRDRSGQLLSSLRYKAVLSISFANEISEEMRYINPLGLLINDIVWSRYL